MFCSKPVLKLQTRLQECREGKRWQMLLPDLLERSLQHKKRKGWWGWGPGLHTSVIRASSGCKVTEVPTGGYTLDCHIPDWGAEHAEAPVRIKTHKVCSSVVSKSVQP